MADLDFAALDDEAATAAMAAANDAFCAAVNRGAVDGYLDWCAPDVFFQSATARADGTSYEGHDGLRAYFRQMRDVLDDMAIEILELERPAPNRNDLRVASP